MPTKRMERKTASTVPVEFAGKWVAWSSDHSQILASDQSLQALWKMAKEQDLRDPVFEKVPRADVSFVGMR